MRPTARAAARPAGPPPTTATSKPAMSPAYTAAAERSIGLEAAGEVDARAERVERAGDRADVVHPGAAGDERPIGGDPDRRLGGRLEAAFPGIDLVVLERAHRPAQGQSSLVVQLPVRGNDAEVLAIPFGIVVAAVSVLVEPEPA